MKNWPLPIIIVAFLLINSGFIGFVYHSKEYFEQSPVKFELFWILFIRILAIVCGVLLLRRIKWARWLAIAWIAYHVVLSMFHSVSETIIHFVLLVIVSILLFLPKSSDYFNRVDLQKEGKFNRR